MKKLLTMMVSCASALFAMAELSTETVTFDGYNATEGGAAIPLDITKDDDLGEGEKYWYSAVAAANEGIAEAVVTNNGEKAYLMLDTSDVLERTIKPWTQGETPTFVPQDIGKGIYFDSLVQFTATEDDVALSEDGKDKLVVWLKAVEGTDAVGTEGEEGYQPAVPGSTNLMITAGNGVDGYNKAIRADFVASGVSIEPNSWHQLTIKAFVDEDGDTLFNVYIDKKPVTGVLNETPVTDFESLVSKAEELLNPTTITSVGFRGTGAVDDLLFTDVNPLVQTFPLTVVVPENVSFIECQVGGLGIEEVDGTFLVDVKATDVKVLVEVPTSFNVTNANAVPDEIVGGMKTWIVPVDITGATANKPLTFTVTVVEATEETELPKVEPAVDENGDPVETKEPYSEAAKTCLTTYFPKGTGTPENPIKLQVVVNGKTLLGDDAVKAINDVAAKFGGDPFDANGTLEVVFKVDDVMKALEGAADGYTLTVGAATLKNTYKVAPKFIDLAEPDVEIDEPGAGATEKFFKLVIKPVTE